MNAPRRRFVAGKMTSPALREASEELDALPGEFAIHCPRHLLDQIMDYAVSYRTTEVFGLLLGYAARMEGGRTRTVISEFISADSFIESHSAYVEVSSAELLRMHEACEQQVQERNLRTVGWFHTHPGHGIFMSAIDRDNHQLYTHPWQVALVLDPQRIQWGFFAGPNCQRIAPELVILDGEPPREKLTEEPKPLALPAPVESAPAPSTPACVPGKKAEDLPETNKKPAASMVLKWGLNRTGWIALIGVVGLIAVFTFMAVENARLASQRALLEEENARIRDLQLRIDDLSRKMCVPNE